MRRAHWELRVLDAGANLYTALVATLAADMLGLRHAEGQLVWPDRSLRMEAASIPPPLPMADTMWAAAAAAAATDTPTD